MELPTQQSFSDESSDEGDAEMVTSIGEVSLLFRLQLMFSLKCYTSKTLIYLPLLCFQLLSHSLFGSLRDATATQATNNGEREDEESSSTSSGGLFL